MRKKDMGRTTSLLNDFNRAREIVKRDDVNNVRRTRDINKSRKTKVSKEKAYLVKIEKGELDRMSSKDLLEFFKDTSSKNGFKYVDSKPIVSMRNFNLAKEKGYSNEDLLLMIEFLYVSEQDYLDKRTLHPGILLTGWCNKIYTDSQDWLNDEYKTDSAKKHSKREWTEEVPEIEETNIGEWGDI